MADCQALEDGEHEFVASRLSYLRESRGEAIEIVGLRTTEARCVYCGTKRRFEDGGNDG